MHRIHISPCRNAAQCSGRKHSLGLAQTGARRGVLGTSGRWSFHRVRRGGASRAVAGGSSAISCGDFSAPPAAFSADSPVAEAPQDLRQTYTSVYHSPRLSSGRARTLPRREACVVGHPHFPPSRAQRGFRGSRRVDGCSSAGDAIAGGRFEGRSLRSVTSARRIRKEAP